MVDALGDILARPSNPLASSRQMVEDSIFTVNTHLLLHDNRISARRNECAGENTGCGAGVKRRTNVSRRDPLAHPQTHACCAAKVGHLGLLPQGQAERDRRVLAMVGVMDAEGFGNCTNQYECSAACPKLISHDFIARMNRDYFSASLKAAVTPVSIGGSGGA